MAADDQCNLDQQGVFDTCKLETVKSRIQASIRSSITYFRSSPSLRTNRGFRNESHLLPQLNIKACISHIRSISNQLGSEIEQHFPGGEADFYIANLAIQRNAFILSLDSDFFITSHGSRGYIPLDSLQFVKKERPPSSGLANGEDTGGWGEVKVSRRRQHSTLASDDACTSSGAYSTISEATQIHCKVYTATALAKSLSLPSVSYLPICAILAGNDYYSPPIWKASNSPSGSAHSNSTNGRAASQRFEIAASAILKQLRKLRKPLDKDGLPEFVRRIIDDIRDFAISDGQISDIARAALATLPEYCVSSISAPSAPWLRPTSTTRSGADTPISISSLGLETESSSTISPLHALLMPATSTTQARTAISEQADEMQTRLRIYNAFENGNFRNNLLQVIVFGTFTPSAVLEDPDKTSTLVSLGRPLRSWVYAILNNSVGIGRLPGEHVRIEAAGQTVETDGSDDDANLTEGSETSQSSTAQTIVTEYVRRNMSLSEEQIIVPEWSSIDPSPSSAITTPLARSTLDRLYILLHATSSYTDRLRDTNGPQFPILSLIISIRHTVLTLDGTGQAWMHAEPKAALLMGLIVYQGYAGQAGAQQLLEKFTDPDKPISNASMQRAAQLTTTLLSVSQLIEALLLTPLFAASPETLYQGSLFFELLEMIPNDEEAVMDLMLQAGLDAGDVANLLDVLEEGLPAIPVSADLTTKGKKKKTKLEKKAAVSNADSRPASAPSGPGLNNKFAMLGMSA